MLAEHPLVGPFKQGVWQADELPRYRTVCEPTWSTVIEVSQSISQLRNERIEKYLDDAETKVMSAVTVFLIPDPFDHVVPSGIRQHIEQLPEPYEIKHPIPIDMEALDSGEIIAHFSDAGIAMSGNDYVDAFENIQAFILDCLNDWKTMTPDQLGPIPTRQFAKLREHVLWA